MVERNHVRAMKRILLTLTMALVATTLYAQNPYLSLEGVVAKADGSVELLQPTTTLTVDLTVTCEETLCGPYARYAQKFLGVRAPLTDKKIWSITGADVALAGEEVLAPQTLAACVTSIQKIVSHIRSAIRGTLVQIARCVYVTRNTLWTWKILSNNLAIAEQYLLPQNVWHSIIYVVASSLKKL